MLGIQHTHIQLLITDPLREQPRELQYYVRSDVCSHYTALYWLVIVCVREVVFRYIQRHTLKICPRLMLFLWEEIYDAADPSGQELLNTHGERSLNVCVNPHLLSIKTTTHQPTTIRPGDKRVEKNSSLPMSFEQ